MKPKKKQAHLVDLLQVQSPQFNADRILSYDDLKGKGTLLCLVEEAKDCLLQKWTSLEQLSLNYVQSFTPLSLVSSHKLAAKMIRQRLLDRGFKRVDSSPQSPYSLHLFLSSSQFGACSSYYDFSPDSLMRQIQGMPDLGAAYLKLPLPPKEEMDYEQIEVERALVKSQVKRLFEKQKGMSGKKVIAHQEQEMIEQGEQKTRLLLGLAGRINLLEDVEVDPTQNCLVFYDDPTLAAQISRSLTGMGKNLFVDLSELEDLKSMLIYDTRPLVQFLEQGQVYASAVSRNRLIRLMERIVGELPHEEARSVSEEKALELEGTALDQALDELSYLALWNLTDEFVQVHLGKILEAASQALPDIEREIFRLERPQRVALLSLDKEKEKTLRKLTCKLFDQGPKSVVFISPKLDLGQELSPTEQDGLATLPPKERERKKQQSLATQNIAPLKDFLERATYELVASRADFLCLELELELLIPLAEALRRTSQIAETPILALVRGWINEASARRAVDLGIKLIYLGQSRADTELVTFEVTGLLKPQVKF